jgi:hypothetical protein
MEFKSKNFKKKKIKNYIEKTRLLFFSSGLNKNYIECQTMQQSLKNLNFTYYQIINRITTKILINSIYLNSNVILNGLTFLLQSNTNCKFLFQSILLDKLNQILIFLLALKLNNKIYKINTIKKSNSLTFFENKSILYKFGIINLKSYLSK